MGVPSVTPEHNVIGGLMGNIHPNVQDLIRKSLLVTLHNQIVAHHDGLVELDQVEKELGSEHFGSW